MQGRRIVLWVTVIAATASVTVNGASEIPGGALVDKILYCSGALPDKGIYYMDYDGSGKTEIVYLEPHEYLQGLFAISPCGSKIAYGSYGRENGGPGVFLINADGSNKTELVGGVFVQFALGFTPDGRELVFITGYPGESKLYSVTLEKTAVTDIPGEIENIRYASFSTDGKLVFFEDDCGEVYRVGKWDIERRRVTYISDENVSAYAPRVSPDGKLIAYGVWEDGKTHLYVMDSEGKDSRRLTYDKNVAPGQYRFSPDSEDIVFAAEGKDYLYAIYKIGVDGSKETKLTFNQSNDIQPVYSPDGRFIAFVSAGRNTNEIFIMNSDGSGLKRLTPEGDAGGSVFSPMLVGNMIIDSYGNKHSVER